MTTSTSHPVYSRPATDRPSTERERSFSLVLDLKSFGTEEQMFLTARQVLREVEVSLHRIIDARIVTSNDLDDSQPLTTEGMKHREVLEHKWRKGV